MTQVKVFEALWGLEGTLEQRLAGIRRRGYDGVEAGVPSVLARLGVITEAEAADFPHLLADHELTFLPMVFTAGPELVPGLTHASSLRRQVEAAMAFDPPQVTAHTGWDSMPLDDVLALFEQALELEAEIGVGIGHETHRGRILFSPFAWREVHRRLPELHTVADISHWVTVCERVPEDLDDLLASCCARAVHVHARVGHPEGPQVSDPRASEYGPAVAWHERWWRQVFAQRATAGAAVTFDPEYGPPPYLPTHPGSGEPLVDLLEVRAWATERVRALAVEAIEGAGPPAGSAA